MTHRCCPPCRLRTSNDGADECPACGRLLERRPVTEVLGLRFVPSDPPHGVPSSPLPDTPHAVAAALRRPRPPE